MPRLTNKHSNAQRIFYPTFDGGLNLEVPPESMSKNELKEAVKEAVLDGVIGNNFEEADAFMRARAAERGLKPVE